MCEREKLRYQCECVGGFLGTNCSVSLKSCDSMPCAYGGEGWRETHGTTPATIMEILDVVGSAQILQGSAQISHWAASSATVEVAIRVRVYRAISSVAIAPCWTSVIHLLLYCR